MSRDQERSVQRRIGTKPRDNDLSKVEFETSKGVDVTPTFDAMGLRDDLLRGIYAYGMNMLLYLIVLGNGIADEYIMVLRTVQVKEYTFIPLSSV